MRKFILALAGSLALASAVLAAPVPANKGIQISPPFNNLVITSDSTPFSIGLKNLSDHEQTLSLTAVDFKSLDETGGVAFVGTTGGAGKYTLAKWMHLDQAQVKIPAGGSTKVGGQIVNDADLAPGGHYGAVLFSLEPPTGSGVALKQVSSSLLFAIKTGGEKYSLNLKSTDAPGFSLAPFSKVRLRFYNGGNVHTIPRGIVTLADSGGKIVSKGVVNDSSSLILPESFRQIPVEMNPIAQPWKIGNYTLAVQYRDDTDAKIKTWSQKIFILSWLGLLFYLLLATAVVAIIIFARKYIKK